jgi:hypothetical protein
MAKEDNLKPFSAGESGNPSGRKKGSKNRATLARKWLAVKSKQTNHLNGKVEHLTQEDLITLALIKVAQKGDVHAYKALMDSAYGAPKQEIETIGQQNIRLLNIDPLSNDPLGDDVSDIEFSR